MAAALTQLTGGNFTDSEGNVLANGYLTFQLSQDGNVAGVGNLCSGITVKIQLDSTGNVAGVSSTPPVSNQYLWANANISPINTFYKVTGYTAAGQRAWGRNQQQIGAGATFNLGSWVPNQVIQWFPTVGATPLAVEVRGAAFSSTTLLNFESSDSSVTITDEGSGLLNFQGNSVSLEVNSTPTSNQTVANFIAGTNVTITNPSGGEIEISASGGGSFSGNGAYFFGPGITDAGETYGSTQWNYQQANIANGSLTANQVVVYLFELLNEFTISKASVLAENNIGGTHGVFGIYTQAGNKILDTGPFVQLTGSGVQTNTFTPVTLPPGIYWHAQAADTASGSFGFLPGLPMSTAAAGIMGIFVQNATRVAIAANALSGTTLPATLGTLTPFTPSHTNADGIVCPLYE